MRSRPSFINLRRRREIPLVLMILGIVGIAGGAMFVSHFRTTGIPEKNPYPILTIKGAVRQDLIQRGLLVIEEDGTETFRQHDIDELIEQGIYTVERGELTFGPSYSPPSESDDG